MLKGIERLVRFGNLRGTGSKILNGQWWRGRGRGKDFAFGILRTEAARSQVDKDGGVCQCVWDFKESQRQDLKGLSSAAPQA